MDYTLLVQGMPCIANVLRYFVTGLPPWCSGRSPWAVGYADLRCGLGLTCTGLVETTHSRDHAFEGGGGLDNIVGGRYSSEKISGKSIRPIDNWNSRHYINNVIVLQCIVHSIVG